MKKNVILSVLAGAMVLIVGQAVWAHDSTDETDYKMGQVM
jgi:hypothetical protein